MEGFEVRRSLSFFFLFFFLCVCVCVFFWGGGAYRTKGFNIRGRNYFKGTTFWETGNIGNKSINFQEHD